MNYGADIQHIQFTDKIELKHTEQFISFIVQNIAVPFH